MLRAILLVTIFTDIYTVSQKTSHLWFVITFLHRNAFWYFLVSIQKMLYCATSNNVCFCTTWQNGETQKSHFFTQMLYQNSTSCSLISSVFFDSWLILTLLYDSLNLVINALSLGLLQGSMVQEKGNWECCSSWTVLSSWKKKMSSVICLVGSNNCLYSKIAH